LAHIIFSGAKPGPCQPLVSQDHDCGQRLLLNSAALPTNYLSAPNQSSIAANLPGDPALNRISNFCRFIATTEYLFLTLP
jgi:hypothetical protein